MFLLVGSLVAALLGATAAVQPAIQEDEKLARATCGGCHAFPPPDILPRDLWRDEFVRMMFIRENRLPPIGPPDDVLPHGPAPTRLDAGAVVLHGPSARTVARA